jgi:hydroxyacylglutathione hydrolase
MEEFMEREQYVCLVCGFNIVGFHPANCPFCGAASKQFITAEECSARYRVVPVRVNDKVTRLNSQPALGIEHAAYRIETEQGACWIDCPSCFDSTLEKTEDILFTHHHFLGASNLYRDFFSAAVHIHREDSLHDICRPFTFDVTFTDNFVHQGIEAYHVDGHTPGFTFYIFQDILFICDYLFLAADGMKYNPFGPADKTIAGGVRIAELLKDRKLTTVCGYNYVVDYLDWKRRFDEGPVFSGY